MEEKAAKKKLWIQEQQALKQRLVCSDSFPWVIPEKFGYDCEGKGEIELKYIGGMDLSFVKENETVACSALVVIDAVTMATVYEDLEIVSLDMPYIPGFLAFRESPALLSLLARMKSSRPEIFPQLLMVDGNGVLHPRGFGLASHLGVLADVPTLGIAKSLFEVDGLSEREVKRSARNSLLRAGDAMDLVGRSGKVWGSALRSTGECVHPVFVSTGHRISLETGVEIVRKLCKFRVPEPVRLADKKSREYLRVNGYTKS
ncbi:hypothetical protein SELMODRAFT_84652 [Selaginella moellendorffii]|uniref:Endonuclease V n=2 Tax=Selaginella moellendorffii TaxID=88036 RepID=D8R3A4_SELML|nr:hypothetical protein SELMODRAFT_84652 [Selaginella moellendorffii]